MIKLGLNADIENCTKWLVFPDTTAYAIIMIKFSSLASQEQPCCYTFTFTLDDNRINEVFTGFPVEDGINVTLGNSTSLPFNHIYTVNITAHNVAGTTNYTGNFSLSECYAILHVHMYSSGQYKLYVPY